MSRLRTRPIGERHRAGRDIERCLKMATFEAIIVLAASCGRVRMSPPNNISAPLMHRSKQHLYSIPYSITSSARAMSFTNGCTLIRINAVARKHKRDVLATPQHVEIKRRVKCLKCEYSC